MNSSSRECDLTHEQTDNSIKVRLCNVNVLLTIEKGNTSTKYIPGIS